MSSVVQYKVVSNVAVVTLDNPPMNSFGKLQREGLANSIKMAKNDSNVKAMLIVAKPDSRVFCAGADITEFPQIKKYVQKGQFPPGSLPEILNELENMPIHVVSGINGAALGGGCELALASHWRIAAPTAQFGLPEVKLGLIPGAGGTQRLPRLIGVDKGLQMIASGRTIKAKVALKYGLIDFLFKKTSKEDFTAKCIEFAKGLIQQYPEGPKDRRTLQLPIFPETPYALFGGFRKVMSRSAPGMNSPLACVDAVEAACNCAVPEDGLQREAEIFGKCLLDPQSAAIQYFFFAERKAGKSYKAKPWNLREVGVIGAGTMGAGIAMCFIEAGISVVLLDIKQEYVDKSLQRIQKLYRKKPKHKVKKMLSLLRGTTNYDDLKNCDAVIEAVFESMEIKHKVFRALEKSTRPDCLLLSNTSTLDIDEIASATRRPDKVLGAHFFSPANKMKLLEVVKGAKTSPETISKVLFMGKKIRKVSVVAGNCFGFIGNRMIEWYVRQAMYLVEDGASPQQVDRALQKFGMRMGPFAMGDLAGNDIGYKIRKILNLKDDKTQRYCGDVGDMMVEAGMLGQKTKQGWYTYENPRRPKPNAAVLQMIDQVRKQKGIVPRKVSDQEIVERCLFSMVNDALNILDEGIAETPTDIDVVYVYGYGFPPHKGGPMYYADQVGMRYINKQLDMYSAKNPGMPHLSPSPLLKKLAKNNMGILKYSMLKQAQVKSQRSKL